MPKPILAAGLFIFAACVSIWMSGFPYSQSTGAQETLSNASLDSAMAGVDQFLQ